jgi:hypothetical protein
MRKFALLALVVAACSGDDGPSVDAPTGNHPEPALIPGGGIGGGAIDGVVHLYVVDDATRAPIAGAMVRVGTTDGVTDAERSPRPRPATAPRSGSEPTAPT